MHHRRMSPEDRRRSAARLQQLQRSVPYQVSCIWSRLSVAQYDFVLNCYLLAAAQTNAFYAKPLFKSSVVSSSAGGHC